MKGHPHLVNSTERDQLKKGKPEVMVEVGPKDQDAWVSLGV